MSRVNHSGAFPKIRQIGNHSPTMTLPKFSINVLELPFTKKARAAKALSSATNYPSTSLPTESRDRATWVIASDPKPATIPSINRYNPLSIDGPAILSQLQLSWIMRSQPSPSLQKVQGRSQSTQVQVNTAPAKASNLWHLKNAPIRNGPSITQFRLAGKSTLLQF